MESDPAPDPPGGDGGGGSMPGRDGGSGEVKFAVAAADSYHDDFLAKEVCNEDLATLHEGSKRRRTTKEKKMRESAIALTGNAAAAAAAVRPALAVETGAIHLHATLATAPSRPRAPAFLPPPPAAAADEGDTLLKELESVLFADMDACDDGNFSTEIGVLC
ncbi:unnamed protein product, partial [Laminaria digitata]